MLTIAVQIRPHHNLADTIIAGTRYVMQMSRDSHTGNTANIGRTTVSICNTLLLYYTTRTGNPTKITTTASARTPSLLQASRIPHSRATIFTSQIHKINPKVIRKSQKEPRTITRKILLNNILHTNLPTIPTRTLRTRHTGPLTLQLPPTLNQLRQIKQTIKQLHELGLVPLDLGIQIITFRDAIRLSLSFSRQRRLRSAPARRPWSRRSRLWVRLAMGRRHPQQRHHDPDHNSSHDFAAHCSPHPASFDTEEPTKPPKSNSSSRHGLCQFNGEKSRGANRQPGSKSSTEAAPRPSRVESMPARRTRIGAGAPAAPLTATKVRISKPPWPASA